MKLPSDPVIDNVVDDATDDATDDAADNFADDTASPVAVALRRVPLTRWVDLLIVFGGVWFVLWVVIPMGCCLSARCRLAATSGRTCGGRRFSGTSCCPSSG